jgi:DNA polymerase/3'-5' exonuclease PolX
MPATTEKKYVDYAEAVVIADRLMENLKPHCVQGSCIIAGSIRCKKPRVGDVEIVCIPKRKVTHVDHTEDQTEMNFEDSEPSEKNMVVQHLHKNKGEDARSYTIIKGGDRYHQIIFAGMQCDIFMTTPKQWGRILALRTGPANCSKKMASRWVSMGYKGYKGELIRMKQDKYGNLTAPYRDENGNRIKPEFPTEKSFFEFLGWDYIEPENRR